MDRLTIRNSDKSVSQPTSTTVEAAFYRLAEYEDTGLTPEQVRNCTEFEDIALDEYIDFNRLRELTQADREGRILYKVLYYPEVDNETGERVISAVASGMGFYTSYAVALAAVEAMQK